MPRCQWYDFDFVGRECVVDREVIPCWQSYDAMLRWSLHGVRLCGGCLAIPLEFVTRT